METNTEINLRPYQSGMVSDIKTLFDNGGKRIMVKMPIGAGKSVVLCSVAKKNSLSSKNTWILTSSKISYRQFCLVIEKINVKYGTICGKDGLTKNRVQICYLHTLIRRLEELPTEPHLLVIDEADLAIWEKPLAKIMKKYPNVSILEFRN